MLSSVSRLPSCDESTVTCFCASLSDISPAWRSRLHSSNTKLQPVFSCALPSHVSLDTQKLDSSIRRHTEMTWALDNFTLNKISPSGNNHRRTCCRLRLRIWQLQSGGAESAWLPHCTQPLSAHGTTTATVNTQPAHSQHCTTQHTHHTAQHTHHTGVGPRNTDVNTISQCTALTVRLP